MARYISLTSRVRGRINESGILGDGLGYRLGSRCQDRGKLAVAMSIAFPQR